MGFSNEEANTVLRRYSNNLERATEYLLNTRLAERSRRALGAEGSVSADAQPAPTTDDDNAQAAATADDSNAQAAEASVEQTQDTEPMSVDSTGQGEEGSREDTNAASDNNNADSSPKPSGILGVEPFTLPEWRKAREAEEDERREQLQKLRETLCASIAPRVIALMNEFKDKAVSQARGVLELVLRKNEAEPTVRVLLDSFMPLLDSVTVAGNNDMDERLAAHAYLWAVLLSSNQLMDEMYQHVSSIGQHLIRALGVAIQRTKTPSWLTALLLVAELLIQRDCQA
ncbi:hypothetical protein IW137_001102 [Coemansia sp. RSA 1287]|nr:hypothetical protein IW137_001102 [Coemansia sp. RSA 1287]